MSGTDYSVTHTRLRIKACERRDCLEIRILNDTKLEDLEYFTVSLERSHGVNWRFRLHQLERNVTITDFDSMSHVMYLFTVYCDVHVWEILYRTAIMRGYVSYVNILLFLDALIRFESHHYPVHEEDQIVTLCAVVERPEGLCDIGFSFNISLGTTNGSAGIHMPLIHCIYDHVVKPIF